MYIIQSGCTIEAVMCPMTMRHATMASDYYKIGLRRHYSLIVRLERWVPILEMEALQILRKNYIVR